jgi:hypothetical protein
VTDATDDEEHLAARMRMPGRPRPRLERYHRAPL